MPSKSRAPAMIDAANGRTRFELKSGPLQVAVAVCCPSEIDTPYQAVFEQLPRDLRPTSRAGTNDREARSIVARSGLDELFIAERLLKLADLNWASR